MNPVISNKQCGYIALYGAKRIEIYANSAYEAKQLALDHFKPNKAKRHLVSVHLCEKDGQQVVQTADF